MEKRKEAQKLCAQTPIPVLQHWFGRHGAAWYSSKTAGGRQCSSLVEGTS